MRPPAGRTAHADFKVLVWYRYNDSIGTFKYEIYDLRKGEYTAKVDDWVKEVQTKHPAYYAVVREVDLTREQGETDLLKVGSVISRELVVAAALAGIVIGSERDRLPAGRLRSLRCIAGRQFQPAFRFQPFARLVRR